MRTALPFLAIILAVLALAFFIPVFSEYMKTGMVPNFPTLIVCGFTMIAAIQALFGMGYTAVRAGFFEGNDASRRVMEKAGMTRVDRVDFIEYRGEKRRVINYEIKAG